MEAESIIREIESLSLNSHINRTGDLFFNLYVIELPDQISESIREMSIIGWWVHVLSEIKTALAAVMLWWSQPYNGADLGNGRGVLINKLMASRKNGFDDTLDWFVHMNGRPSPPLECRCREVGISTRPEIGCGDIVRELIEIIDHLIIKELAAFIG